MKITIILTKEQFTPLAYYIGDKKQYINVLEVKEKSSYLETTIFYTSPEYLFNLGLAIGKNKHKEFYMGSNVPKRWEKYIKQN